MAKLRAKEIIAFSRYRDANFDLLFNYLTRNGVEIEKNYSELKRLISIDKFYWRSADRLFPADSRGRIRGDVVTHGGIHYLPTLYPHDLKGMPQFTLLAEALASCSDLFFSLTYFQKEGYGHPFFKTFFPIFNDGIELSGLSRKAAEHQLMHAQKNLFGFYRKCVLEFFDLSRLLLELDGRAHRKLDSKISKIIKSKKYLAYFLKYDFSGYVLYTGARCGTLSSVLDRKYVTQCLRYLKASNSMEELLTRLGAYEHPVKGTLKKSA